MGLRSFEKRIEHLVEGTFARVFKSGLTPLEVAHRITSAMDDNRSAGVSGGTVVPNQYWIYLAPEDHERFAEVETALSNELMDAIREHARDEQYGFMGPLHVDLVLADDYPTGAFEIVNKFREGPQGAPPGVLVLTRGDRIDLGSESLTVGRVAGNRLVLADPNVSRNHAEVRLVNGAWVLVDLGSTNGTTVNGNRVVEHQLQTGDEIAFGSATARFESF